MIGFTASGGTSSLNTLVASGDGGGRHQGVDLLVVLLVLLFTIVMAVIVAMVNRFQQPLSATHQNPFKVMFKTVMFAVAATMVTVAVLAVIIASVSTPS